MPIYNKQKKAKKNNSVRKNKVVKRGSKRKIAPKKNWFNKEVQKEVCHFFGPGDKVGLITFATNGVLMF